MRVIIPAIAIAIVIASPAFVQSEVLGIPTAMAHDSGLELIEAD